MNIAAQIEAVLFWKAEPIAKNKLANMLNIDRQALDTGIAELEGALGSRGLTLIQTGEEVMLGTAKAASTIIERLTKEELDRDLGKAGTETLSIILYQGPISRPEIDYIRGVNSQFILRALLIRGLIERIENPADARSYLYKPTLNLLAFLGVDKIENLPEYAEIRKAIQDFKSEQHSESSHAVQGYTEPK